MKFILSRCLLLVFLLFPLFCFAQKSNPAYLIYNEKGREISYRKFIRSLAKADIVLFGEFHNNPICHWLELEVAQDLYKKRTLTLGAEMLEADNQAAVDAYLSGGLDLAGLDSLARLWNNFNTDYKPVLDFAAANSVEFVATNIPRRYASMVYRGGFSSLDTLPPAELATIAPLPISYDAELPGYKAMMEMAAGHGGANLPKAQAIKDATMAYFILKNHQPGDLFLHYNGAYHSDNFEGIYWYLKREKPPLHIQTISAVSQENIHKLEEENCGKATFIICIPQNMTTTY